MNMWVGLPKGSCLTYFRPVKEKTVLQIQHRYPNLRWLCASTAISEFMLRAPLSSESFLSQTGFGLPSFGGVHRCPVQRTSAHRVLIATTTKLASAITTNQPRSWPRVLELRSPKSPRSSSQNHIKLRLRQGQESRRPPGGNPWLRIFRR